MKSYTEKLQRKLHRPINSLEEFMPPHFFHLGKQSMSEKLTSNDYIQPPDGKWRLKKPLENMLACLSFDDEDVAYLTPEQLKNEVKTAEIEQGIAQMWAKDADVIYWREYRKVCQLALVAQRVKQPKTVNGKFSIQAVRESHDIADVISRYTELRKAGLDYKGRCPFHDDKQPSLSVSEAKQRFHCFSCEQRGDVIQFIMQMENLDLNGACRFLAGK